MFERLLKVFFSDQPAHDWNEECIDKLEDVGEEEKIRNLFFEMVIVTLVGAE